jgi:hypothetical protein
MRALAAPLDLSALLFRSRGKFNWSLAIAVFGLAIAQAGAVALVSWLEGTWTLGLEGSWTLERGKGFSQHYGAWAILITDPLLLIACGFLDRQFVVTLMTLPLRRGQQPKERAQQLLRKYAAFVRAKGLRVVLYVLMVIVGVLAWGQNVRATYDPSGPHHHPIFDHHDVFDSGLHIWSYLTFKACLFVSWVIIYPLVAYKFLTIAISTWIILRTIEREGHLCPRVEHPDGCYGLRNVGTLNIAILAPCLLVFSAIYALWITHQMVYGSLILPSIALLTFFLVTSFVVIWPVYSSLCRARMAAFKELVDESVESPSKSDSDLYRFTARRFFYHAASASPYSVGTKTLITAMRAAPILVFGFKLLRSSDG